MNQFFKIVVVILISVTILVLIGYVVGKNEERISEGKIMENTLDHSKGNLELENSENINGAENISIKITMNGKQIKAFLYPNETVFELIKLFPMQISMRDLNSNEKYTYLEKNLKTSPVIPERIKKGDIKLYQNNCLVIFYEDFKNAYTYTDLGYIEESESIKEELKKEEVIVLLELDK